MIPMIHAQKDSATNDDVGSQQNASGRLSKPTKARVRTPHPTLANYRRVWSVLNKEPELWKRVDKGTVVGVFSRDRKCYDFPQDVIAITEELHKQGVNFFNVSAKKILREAIRIILNDTPSETVVWEPGTIEISFRIPEKAAKVLDKMMKAHGIIGISSRNQFVRRIALDFTTQRLTYTREAGAPRVDWEKLVNKGAGAVAEEASDC